MRTTDPTVPPTLNPLKRHLIGIATEETLRKVQAPSTIGTALLLRRPIRRAAVVLAAVGAKWTASVHRVPSLAAVELGLTGMAGVVSAKRVARSHFCGLIICPRTP